MAASGWGVPGRPGEDGRAGVAGLGWEVAVGPGEDARAGAAGSGWEVSDIVDGADGDGDGDDMVKGLKKMKESKKREVNSCVKVNSLVCLLKVG